MTTCQMRDSIYNRKAYLLLTPDPGLEGEEIEFEILCTILNTASNGQRRVCFSRFISTCNTSDQSIISVLAWGTSDCSFVLSFTQKSEHSSAAEEGERRDFKIEKEGRVCRSLQVGARPPLVAMSSS